MADTRIKDLHLLPKFGDRLTYLYAEHSRIDRHESAIALHDLTGMTPVPAASLAVLMLGPGTSVSHEAVKVLADNNCLVVWCGEENVRFYAFGIGGTRSASRIIKQAALVSDEASRLAVVKRMYRMRFEDDLSEYVTVEQLRGMEGARVRGAYARISSETGIEWAGRSYDRTSWKSGDPVNRALSAANSCLYGICHAAIVTAGYSPALGFIHQGKQLSFVYDIADLYKTEITIPLAFRAAAEGPEELERHVRLRCRDVFRQERLVERILPDIRHVLGTGGDDEEDNPFDSDEARPGELWRPESEKREDC